MTLITWLPLATVCLMGAMSPGPSLALVIKHTVNGGTRNGLLAAIGHGIGVGLYALMTIAGLALVITTTPWLFAAIQYAGVAFLLLTAWRTLKQPASPMGQAQTNAKKASGGFVEGLLLALLNPKLALFFLALFSQFIAADQSINDKIIMILTVSLIDMLWYCLVAAGIGQTPLIERLHQHQLWINRITALIYIGLAATVLLL